MNNQQMDLLKNLDKANNVWPKTFRLHAAYDYKLLRAHFNLEEVGAHTWAARGFIETACKTLNSPRAQQVMKGLDLSPQFDVVASSLRQPVIVCRFLLPIERPLIKAAVSFLLEAIYTDEMSSYTEKVVLNHMYFTLVSKIPSVMA